MVRGPSAGGLCLTSADAWAEAGIWLPLLLWLRGLLREWAESLLAPDRLRREGWLNAEAVSRMWQRTLAGKVFVEMIWSALMFQAWLEYRGSSRQKP